MLGRLKQYILIACGIGVFYFFLSHHIIIEVKNWRNFDLLKKSELTLKYTFFSIEQASPEDVLRIDELRDAGIADLMLERGLVSQEELQRILQKIDFQQ